MKSDDARRKKAGPPHVCRPDRTCTCSVQALEPDERCPIHGGGEWPRRCGTCGKFIIYLEQVQ